MKNRKSKLPEKYVEKNSLSKSFQISVANKDFSSNDVSCVKLNSHRNVKELLIENLLASSCCSEICRADVMLVDDVLFNLIPLEGMLKVSFGIKSI